MALTPELAPEILAACSAGAVEAAAALSRALDDTLTLTPGKGLTAAEAVCLGPGLLVVLKLGEEAAVLAIPESCTLLPAWYAAPDATGTSKLTTLAQELGMLLLPENCMPDDFAALRVDDIAAALHRGGLVPTAGAISFELASKTHADTVWLLWPLPNPDALAEPSNKASAPPVAAPPVAAPAAEPPRRAALAIGSDSIEEALPEMPTYTRSLLKIRVPIVVTLAKSQQPLSRIVELAPGSIIPFDKSCDDTLSLEVNNREVAVGEAVKVGDKFGLRITSMLLPPERFMPLKAQ